MDTLETPHASKFISQTKSTTSPGNGKTRLNIQPIFSIKLVCKVWLKWMILTQYL